MERIDIEKHLLEEERTEFDQRVMGGGLTGQRLILTGVSCAVGILILYGVAKQNNWLGMGGDMAEKKTLTTVSDINDQPKPKITLPDIVDLREVANEKLISEAITCNNGMKLPKGMPCPDLQPPSRSAAPPVDSSLARKLGGTIQAPVFNNGSKDSVTALSDAESAFLKAKEIEKKLNGGQVEKGEGLSSRIPETFTPKAYARIQLNPSLTLAKGQMPDCTLVTAINTSRPGFLKCQLSFPVLSLDGKVVLMESGTTLEGEYKSNIQQGQALIQTIITRARTPKNIIIPLDSLATDPLGRSGVAGEVDNKWIQRFGGAIVSAIIEDGIEVYKANSSNGSNGGDGNFITQHPNTNSSSKAITDEFLKQGSKVRPDIHVNQGSVIKIFVSRDIDFSKVYKLKSKRRYM